MSDNTPQPVHKPPPHDWPPYELFNNVAKIFGEIPRYFKSAITISGIRATEIYAFGEVLGITIEQEVVRSLNELRFLWDPTQQYTEYVFSRQAQTFPDVLLVHPQSTEIIMGIELKSWYLLAKESVPSFRYKVTPNACAPQDLLMVVPWVLSNVLSGNPIIFKPYVELARYVAEYRNFWWQNLRGTQDSTEIISPLDAQPYPKARSKIVDRPTYDPGGNFGRIARVGLMDQYVQEFDRLDLLGVEVSHWRKFLKQRAN